MSGAAKPGRRSTVGRGDSIHPCITVRSLSYTYAYRHPDRFVVTRVLPGRVRCRIVKDGVVGRGVFTYNSWVRMPGCRRVML